MEWGFGIFGQGYLLALRARRRSSGEQRERVLLIPLSAGSREQGPMHRLSRGRKNSGAQGRRRSRELREPSSEESLSLLQDPETH